MNKKPLAAGDIDMNRWVPTPFLLGVSILLVATGAHSAAHLITAAFALAAGLLTLPRFLGR